MVTEIRGQHYRFGSLESNETYKDLRIMETEKDISAFNHRVDVRDLGKEGARVDVFNERLDDEVSDSRISVGGNFVGIKISEGQTTIIVPTNGVIRMFAGDNSQEVVSIKHSEFGNF